jgi:hypothetical protein
MEPHGGRSAECKGKCKGRCHVAARARATKTKRTTTTTAARPETNERAVGRNSTAQRCAALRCAAAHTTPIRPPCSPAQTRHSPAEVAAQPADPPGRSCNHGVQASLAPPRSARKSDAVVAGPLAPRPLTRQRPGPRRPPHPLFRYPARPHRSGAGRYLQTARRRGAGEFLFASLLCLMLSQCGPSAPSPPARPYS